MGDVIENLPIDEKNVLDKSDIDLVNILFKTNVEEKKTRSEFKENIAAGLLFLILSSPLSSTAIRFFGTENEYMIWAAKFVIFVILFYILKHWVL